MKGNDRRTTMKQYLLAIYQPDGPPPEDLDLDAIMRDVRALQDEMKEAGAWVFGAGLHDASTATTVQVRDGDLLTTDGPYLEGKEHLGGFDLIQAPDLDAALGWARRVAEILSPLAIEVRPLVEEH
jgi:hypothetical protein